MNEYSSPVVQWLSIAPLGLGSAIVNQATLISLLAHVEQSQIAVATGFSQLWKCIGQVIGVAIPSAVFQYLLTRELTARITGPGSEEVITQIRHSSRLIQSLPPDLQRPARDSYGVALSRVFWYLALSTLVAFVVRLGIPARSLDDSLVHHRKGHVSRDSEGSAAAEESQTNVEGNPVSNGNRSVV